VVLIAELDLVVQSHIENLTLTSLSLHLLKSWLCSMSSLPSDHSSWISHLCLNFWARCSKRSNLVTTLNTYT